MSTRIGTRAVGLASLLVFLAALPLRADYPVQVVDDRGKEISIAKRPERVITLLSIYAEILVDLGAAARIVGVAQSPDNPAEVAGLPKVGSAFEPSVEKIIALKPDLVLGAVGKAREALEAAGIVVFTGGKSGGVIDGLAEVFRLIRSVGLLLHGDSQKTDAFIGRLAENILLLESRVFDRPKPSVAILFPLADGPPFVAAKGTPEHEVLLRAGGSNAFADLAGYPQVSLEELIKRNPQIILADPSQVSLITKHPLLQGIQAVKSGKVLGLSASAWSSSRVDRTLREVIKLLHGDIFKHGS